MAPSDRLSCNWCGWFTTRPHETDRRLAQVGLCQWCWKKMSPAQQWEMITYLENERAEEERASRLFPAIRQDLTSLVDSLEVEDADL